MHVHLMAQYLTAQFFSRLFIFFSRNNPPPSPPPPLTTIVVQLYDKDVVCLSVVLVDRINDRIRSVEVRMATLAKKKSTAKKSAASRHKIKCAQYKFDERERSHSLTTFIQDPRSCKLINVLLYSVCLICQERISLMLC